MRRAVRRVANGESAVRVGSSSPPPNPLPLGGGVKAARRGSRAGVVLVDVLVAAVVMGVALAVLVGMAGRAISSQRQGERLSIAAMLVDEQLNQVLMRGPDNYGGRFGLEGTCDAPFTDYRYKIEFTGQASGGDPYDVTATVLWNEGGREKSVVVETMLSPRIATEPDPDRKPPQKVERVP